MMGDSFENELNSRALVDAIRDEFSDSNEPATLRQLASVYGAMASQIEAMIAVYALAMKANPSLIFSDQAVLASKRIGEASDLFSEVGLALIKDADESEGEA